MATKEQPVILKKARLTAHPLRLSPQPATKSNAQCTSSPWSPRRPRPRDALAPLSVPCAPFNPAGNSSHIVSFRPRQEDLADVPSGFWNKGPFQVRPPPPAPPPDLTQFAAA